MKRIIFIIVGDNSKRGEKKNKRKRREESIGQKGQISQDKCEV